MVMKVHILVLGSPTIGRQHARSKTLSLSYNMHLFVPYSLKRFIFQTPPLRAADLLDWSISFKAVSAVLLCVQRYRGNRYKSDT